MPRKLRIQYSGAIYHVIDRGDRREDIFLDETDRHRFLETLGEACGRTEWAVHAYCLMRNHFHLVMKTPRANLSVGMQWLLTPLCGKRPRANSKSNENGNHDGSSGALGDPGNRKTGTA